MRLCADRKSPDSFTYGHPAVRVYREKMKGTVEAREALTAEQFRDAEISEQRRSRGIA